MVAALLFIIAGLLFSFTGAGILIGVPMIVIGFIIMFSIGFDKIGPIGALLIIGALLFAFSGRAHAADDKTVIQPMLSVHACMIRAAGENGDTVRAIIRAHGNPLLMLTNKCSDAAVAFSVACENAGYEQDGCINAIIGDAKDIISAVAISDEMAP